MMPTLESVKLDDGLFTMFKGIVSSSGCWFAQGYLVNHDGYLRVKWNGKNVYLHRLSFCLTNNLDYNDNSFQVNHKCDIRRCWNPEHLYKGTHLDNMSDRVKRITHCPMGHEYNETNPKHHKGCRICYKEYIKKYYNEHKEKWSRHANVR